MEPGSWPASVGYEWAQIAPGIEARLPMPLGGGNGGNMVLIELRRDDGESGVTASVHPTGPGGDGVHVHVTARIDGADLYRAVARQMHLHAQRNPGRRQV